jgi:hypothetical protein
MNRSLLILAASASLALTQDASSIRLKVVRNAPFSAHAQTESIQILADGNRITRTSSATIVRDSEGRTRREQIGAGIVFISDPVLGMAYVLDTRARSVRQFAIPSAEADSAEKPSSAAAQSAAIGTKDVEGFLSDGTRLTRLIAADKAGNEQPIEVSSETWYSSELQIVLASRTADPRTGETKYKVTDIQRAEPDPALFQIPADYQTQNSTGK